MTVVAVKMLHVKSAALYWMLSTVMVFFNKNLMNIWQFNFPLFLITTEMLVNSVAVLGLDYFRLVSFKSLNKLRTQVEKDGLLKAFSQFKYHLVVALFYSLHSVTALKALNGLSVPIYIILKRCGPFINYILSIFMFKNDRGFSKSDNKIKLSILAMTAGVIMAGKLNCFFVLLDFSLILFL